MRNKNNELPGEKLIANIVADARIEKAKAIANGTFKPKRFFEVSYTMAAKKKGKL